MVFLVAGDVNADLAASLARFPHEGDDSPMEALAWGSGGSPANLATALGRLGGRTRLLARVGEDPAAEVALRAARAAGVSLDLVQRDAARATGLCFAAISPGGQRTFFSHRGANVALAIPDLDAAFRGVAFLHLGAHALLEAPARATALALMAEAARRAVPVSLDLCLPLLREARGVVLDVLPRVEVLFANEDEAALLGALPATARPRLCVWKRGAEGAVVERESQSGHGHGHGHGHGGSLTQPGAPATGLRSSVEPLFLPPFAVTACDTTGCGDAFVAGFLLGLSRGASLAIAGQLGCGAGALTATRTGAAEALPTRAELAAFLVARGAREAAAVLEPAS